MRKTGRKKRMVEHHKMLRDMRKWDKRPRCKRCGAFGAGLRKHKEPTKKAFHVCKDIAGCRARITHRITLELTSTLVP